MNSPTFIIVSILITTLAYIIKGVLGFGPSLIFVPVFSVFINIKTTILLGALSDLFSGAILVFGNKRKVEWKYAKPIGLGLLTGTMIGVFIFKNANAELIKRILGVFILAYIVFTYLSNNIVKGDKSFKNSWAILSGVIGGICGGIFNTNGPPLVMYLNKVLKNKRYIRSTLMTLFLIDSVWRVTLFTVQGMMSWEVIRLFFMTVFPSLLLGLWIARKIDKNIKTNYYKNLVNGLLFFSGLKMIVG